MKRNLLFVPAIVAIALAAGMTSCGDSTTQQKSAPAKAQTTKNTDTSKLPNYRYVDVDTVLAQYNLSKDYQESMLHMQNNIEATMKQKENSLQSMSNTFQQKYQNNQYKSQEEFERDQKQFANAQAAAQKEAAQLQSNYEKQSMEMQKSVRDSIINYIKIYNKDLGYDAIFMKDAALYINPDLDVTEDIVKGLNERYNKVKK